MILSDIELSHFRHFDQLALKFQPGIQVIVGANGSGKSSILESILYVSQGRSFRATRSSTLIQHQHDQMIIWLTMASGTSLALSKTQSGRTELRINDSPAQRQSELARHLPVIFIDTHSHRLFAEDPKHRRSLIDWMMFHVKHSMHEVALRYKAALKQRNEALKNGGRDAHVWDDLICQYGQQLHEARQEVCEGWLAILHEMVLPFQHKLTMTYQRGWDETMSLSAALKRSRFDDLRRGYTTVGPHRFDLCVQQQGLAMSYILSQGQQKTLYGTMRLAAAKYVQQCAAKEVLWLIDDLPAELDQQRQHCWLDELKAQNEQVIVTALPSHQLDLPVITELDEVHV